MGLIEPFKKWKRTLDIYMTSKRAVILLLSFFILLFYLSPQLITSYSFFSDTSQTTEGILNKCIEDHVAQMYHNVAKQLFVFRPDEESENAYLPFVGNGLFGVIFHPQRNLYLKDTRTLSVNTHWNPLLSINPSIFMKEVFFTNTLTGTVNRYQCFSNGLIVSSMFLAHRTVPNLFYQDIIISNPTDHELIIEFEQMKYPDWTPSNGYSKNSNVENQFFSFSGILKNYTKEESLIASISAKGKPQSIEILGHRTKHISFPVAIHYDKIRIENYASLKWKLEQKCKETLNWALTSSSLKSHQGHVAAWQNLWKTGLTISHSKAASALNDDHINATLYYVLSNVMMNNSENYFGSIKNNMSTYISIVEGCYGGYHHTLQALGLWKKLSTYQQINEIVSLWLLTLEKQGCHKLLLLGAEGVMQAMSLSFGGFRFSSHHLEFKIDPKFLHRDYYFRRIKVDYNVHINVSVILQENNKARLGVSIDKIDKEFYACEGGCINTPVQLRTSESYFPVKMTEPITSILYITSDKSHIELIKDTLHVHKIVEAPPHDHHVLALHRHGSHLGGLPLMFWATVITLIVIFHLFLCKLIFNEYCGKSERIKGKYSRVSTE